MLGKDDQHELAKAEPLAPRAASRPSVIPDGTEPLAPRAASRRSVIPDPTGAQDRAQSPVRHGLLPPLSLPTYQAAAADIDKADGVADAPVSPRRPRHAHPALAPAAPKRSLAQHLRAQSQPWGHTRARMAARTEETRRALEATRWQVPCAPPLPPPQLSGEGDAESDSVAEDAELDSFAEDVFADLSSEMQLALFKSMAAEAEAEHVAASSVVTSASGGCTVELLDEQ